MLALAAAAKNTRNAAARNPVILLRIYAKELFLSVLFAVLYSAGFNSPAYSWAAFLCLVPLLFCIRHCNTRREALVFGLIAGILASAFTYYWILHVTKFGWLALSLYMAIFPALFAFLAYGAVQQLVMSGSQGFFFVWIKVFALASLWTLIEYLRSHVPIMEFPWALLAYSQWKNLIFIQSADTFGAFGVSFVIAVVNAAIFYFLADIKNLFRRSGPNWQLVVGFTAVAAITGSLVWVNMSYGKTALARIKYQEKKAESIRVSVIQGNIPQEEKWDERIQHMVFNKYEALTLQVAMDHPDLIIWPETAFPGFWEYEPEMVERVAQLARDTNAELLVGAPTMRGTGHNTQRMNSAVQLSKEGKEIRRYHKLHLVPFGEYIPFFQFIRKFFDEIGHFSAGEEKTLFRTRSAVYSVLICFEDIFPDLCRAFVNRGSRLLVNITNDAWFKDSSGPYQHAQSSVFRAVENRVPVLRAANTGLSGYVHPSGKISHTVSVKGKEIMVTGFKTFDVFVPKTRTLYSQRGDVFVLLLLAFWTLSVFFYRSKST